MAFGSLLYDARATWQGRLLLRSEWNRNAYCSDDERHAFRFTHLRALLLDAAGNVPYYRELFQRLGFQPGADFREISDLARLPILSKDTVRADSHLLRRDPLPSRSICERTSGSTGEPLGVWVSPSQIAVEKATVWRHWSWVGYRFRDPVAIVRTYVPKEGEPLWRHDRLRNFLYFSAYHLDSGHARIFLDRIRKFRPRFLRGYPSSLAILADIAMERGWEPPALRAVLTASETLSRAVREKLTRVFRAPVSDWYGLAEQVVTAAQCEHGEGMHRHDDYGYWELIPCNDGTSRCRIIGTNLHNAAMPLIRYDTGDIAESSELRQCPCGRTFPLISGISGREDDDLVDLIGRRIPSVNLYSVFREFDAIRRFQIVQARPDQVEVRLDAPAATESELSRLNEELRLRLGEGLGIRMVRDAEFERNPHGKRRAVIRRCPVRTEDGR